MTGSPLRRLQELAAAQCEKAKRPVDTEASTAVWQMWLTDLFPAPVPASTSV